jgi:hypothetical protein
MSARKRGQPEEFDDEDDVSLDENFEDDSEEE